MSYTGYGQRLQPTLDRESLLRGEEIQRRAHPKRLQKAEEKGEIRQQEIQKNVKSKMKKDEINERERRKKQEEDRIRRAETNSGAKHRRTGETKKEFLPPVPKTKGGRVVKKPERNNPAGEEKRHVLDAETEREARQAGKWLDKMYGNNQRSNTILDSLRKTLKKMKLPSIK